MWLTAGLLLVAVFSAAITWHLRRTLYRRQKAAELLEIVSLQSVWIEAQQSTNVFALEEPDENAPLQSIVDITQRWFPELSLQAQALAEAQGRLVEFSNTQKILRHEDTEAWLESDHEMQFARLWREHTGALNALTAKLEVVAGIQSGQAERTINQLAS